MILPSLLETFHCLKVEKNEKAFLSRYSELLDLVYLINNTVKNRLVVAYFK